MQNLLVQGQQVLLLEDQALCKFRSETDAAIYNIDVQLDILVKVMLGKLTLTQNLRPTSCEDDVHCAQANGFTKP